MSASEDGLSWGLSGAILAGGLSRRMGRDKAMTPVPETGRTMLETVFAALSTVTSDIVIVAPSRDGYEQFGVPIVADAPGPPGPLRGIAAAIGAVRQERCLVLACDLPFVNPTLLRWMDDLRSEADALVPVTRGSSRQGGEEVQQTLHAIYRRSCLPAIQRNLARGDPRTTAFLADVHVQFVDEQSLRRIDPPLRSFSNVNTPADWARAPIIYPRAPNR